MNVNSAVPMPSFMNDLNVVGKEKEVEDKLKQYVRDGGNPNYTLIDTNCSYMPELNILEILNKYMPKKNLSLMSVLCLHGVKPNKAQLQSIKQHLGESKLTLIANAHNDPESILSRIPTELIREIILTSLKVDKFNM